MMRAFMFLAALNIAAGCATIPDSAPPALHQAARAIKAADDAGAEKIVPKSLEVSKARFDDALRFYSDDQVAAAIKAANDAEGLATRALRLTNDLRDEDGGDLLSYEASRRAASDLVNAKAQLAQARAARQTVSSGPSMLGIAQPIAYFDTAAVSVVDSSQPALNELISALQKDPHLHVNLIGYADRRGAETLNDKLARARVIAVATYLTEQGIAAPRIRILSRGAKDAAADAADVARLQLDRRVDALVVTDDASNATLNTAH